VRIAKYALAFIVGIFAAYDNLVIPPIFDAAIGIDGDHSPCTLNLCGGGVICA
jgi:hypothetical protein